MANAPLIKYTLEKNPDVGGMPTMDANTTTSEMLVIRNWRNVNAKALVFSDFK
jgi:hypothetical protein